MKQKVQLTVNEVNALMKINLFKIFLQKGEKSTYYPRKVFSVLAI